jgi:hypothetical protein
MKVLKGLARSGFLAQKRNPDNPAHGTGAPWPPPDRFDRLFPTLLCLFTLTVTRTALTVAITLTALTTLITLAAFSTRTTLLCLFTLTVTRTTRTTLVIPREVFG